MTQFCQETYIRILGTACWIYLEGRSSRCGDGFSDCPDRVKEWQGCVVFADFYDRISRQDDVPV